MLQILFKNPQIRKSQKKTPKKRSAVTYIFKFGNGIIFLLKTLHQLIQLRYFEETLKEFHS